MTFLLATTLKVSALMLIALGAATLLRRASAALRHWVLAVAVLGAAVVPLASLTLPAWHLPLAALSRVLVTDVHVPRDATSLTLVAGARDAASDDATVASAAPRGRTIERLAIGLWLTGITIAAGLLSIAMWRLRRLASRSKPIDSGAWHDVAREIARSYGIRGDVRLLHSPHATMLVTWGCRSPRILVPAGASSWTEQRVRIVLSHELAHVRRADWILMLAAAVIRCLYWFNPFVWIACRQMRHESERACDDEVMRSGITGADYAAQLLAVARETVFHRAWSPAAAIAHPSTLEGRIRAMLNRRQNREPVTTWRRAATAVAVIALALPIAAASGPSGDSSASRGALNEGRPASVSPARATETPDAARPLDRDSDRAVAEAAGRAPAARAANAAAQAGAASFRVVFYDQLGGLLPGVRVVLSGPEGPVRHAVTDDRGSSAFDQLRAGMYVLDASLPGFQNRTRRFELNANDSVNQTITMALGSVEETVTVSGGPPDPEQTARAARMATAEFLAELAKVRGRRAAPTSRITSPCVGAVGGCVRPPKMVSRANPVYPAALQASGAQGAVRVTAQIGVNGLLTNIQAVGDHQELIDATLQALNQWEFEPTYLNGVPVETNILITVEFKL